MASSELRSWAGDETRCPHNGASESRARKWRGNDAERVESEVEGYIICEVCFLFPGHGLKIDREIDRSTDRDISYTIL